MREILFRGKRVDNGDWVIGYYIKANHHWHNQGIHKDWIVVDTIQNGGWCNVRGKYAVIPETVGQYTGLTDKNGTKIFEGDIVKVEYIGNARGIASQIAEVVFEKCKFTLAYGWHKEIVCLTDFANVSFEVIGNIHDNPELLKEREG